MCAVCVLSSSTLCAVCALSTSALCAGVHEVVPDIPGGHRRLLHLRGGAKGGTARHCSMESLGHLQVISVTIHYIQ